MQSLEGPHYVVSATVQVKLLVDSEGKIHRAALDMEARPEVILIAYKDGVSDLQSDAPNPHYSIIAEGQDAQEHRIGELVVEAEWPNIESGLL